MIVAKGDGIHIFRGRAWMIAWISIVIGCIALTISIVALILNWRHSESLFRRREYPAVAWYSPKLSKEGPNTVLTTSVCNTGPRDIGSIFLGVFLCRGLTVKAWCRSERIEKISIGEPLEFVITKNLETDIAERFHGLFYDNCWRFKGKPKRHKIICKLEYLPHIADTPHYNRRAYYLLTPHTEGGVLESWELRPIREWRRWLPWF